ncbi:MAG: hypothetical protein ACLQED_06160 [Desulfobaccales bacterium]
MTPSPGEQWNRIYHIVGVITITWAFIERFMDDSILFIYNFFDGKTISKKVPKTKLILKIELLQMYLEQLPKLSHYKDNGLRIINTIKDFSSQRHWLVHGTLIKVTPDVLHFTKYKYGESKHQIENFEHKITDLESYTKALRDLKDELSDLAQHIAEDAMLQKRDLQ